MSANDEKTDPKGARLKFGILPSPQHTTWDALRDVGQLADRLGYDSLWCSDHLYAPYPGVVGPAFEAYMILAGWAASTEKVTLGAMVGSAGFRNPALVVKMATALDHISHGRAVIGIGAGWFEEEHRAFGFDFGTPGERLGRLTEALGIIRRMLAGEPASGSRFYRHEEVRNLPGPVQDRLPILIGGRGKKMLGVVAQYADAWNIQGTIDDVREKDATLRAWCEQIGRDQATIERNYHGGPVFIRSTVREARAVAERTFAAHGIGNVPIPLVGPPEHLVDRLSPFAELGFHTMYFDLLSPYDEESLVRLIQEVRPMLESCFGSDG